MSIKIAKYIVGFLVILLNTGCATTNFEWVKINPEKIQLAKKTVSYSDKVRQVNIVLQLKEKDNVLYYPESEGFFVSQKSKTEVVVHKSPLQKNIGKRVQFSKPIKLSTVQTVASITKESAAVSSATAVVKIDLEASKLNAALKIPLNSNGLRARRNTASFGSSASEIREMAFNDIKKKNPELERKSFEKQQRGKNLIWAGLVLVVLGGVMGFIFGRSAFVIALAGVVFAGVGYFFKI